MVATERSRTTMEAEMNATSTGDDGTFEIFGLYFIFKVTITAHLQLLLMRVLPFFAAVNR